MPSFGSIAIECDGFFTLDIVKNAVTKASNVEREIVISTWQEFKSSEDYHTYTGKPIVKEDSGFTIWENELYFQATKLFMNRNQLSKFIEEQGFDLRNSYDMGLDAKQVLKNIIDLNTK